MEVVMNAYQLNQEWNDLRWGTPMPIMTMIAAQLTQFRARGVCSVSVADPAKLAEKIPDPASLPGWVKSLITQIVTDVIAERAGQVSDVTQLNAGDAQIVQAFQANLEAKLAAIGLRLKTARIEMLEKV
jgi:membrane protease subunit (stomatin/prohibitin family)